MKKLLIGIISLSLLLPACKPHDVALAEKCASSTVLIHMKVAIPAHGKKKEREGWGTCSGVYVSPTTILTANHCIDMPDGMELREIWVKNFYGDSSLATVIKASPMRDLALLKTPLRGTPVKLAKTVTVGEPCYIIGNPLGLQFVVTKGIVSKLDYYFMEFPINHFITDATALPGNSGGPCFNSKGQLIGILTMSTSMLGSLGAAGLGIAVQIDEVKTFLKVK